jgi:N utilization substance protein B
MRKRTQAREFALQILYQVDIRQAELADVLQSFWDEKADRDEKEPEITEYTETLVRGVIEKLASIDKTIERYAENWEMKRMAYVDRNILRLATYEMLHLDEIPVKVAINEAVELAKRYGEPDSSKFVNGILDRIAKTECQK